MSDSSLFAQTLAAASVVFGVLGKTLYREPSRQEIDQLIEAQVFAEIPFGFEQPQTQQGVALLRAWTAENADGLSQACYEAIRHDFLYLFAGVGHPLASPWESTYFNESCANFDKQTLQVRQWYKSYGLEIERKNKEPDDHIAYECSFIGHLAGLAAKAEAEAACVAEAAAAARAAEAQAVVIVEARAAQAAEPIASAKVAAADDLDTLVLVLRDFLNAHPLVWAYTWVAKVEEHAQSDFYKGLALLVGGSLAALVAVLESSAAREGNVRA